MKKPTKIRCLVKSCWTTIPKGQLMCDLHWRKLPKELRDAVHDTWSHGNPKRGYRAYIAQALNLIAKEKA